MTIEMIGTRPKLHPFILASKKHWTKICILLKLHVELHGSIFSRCFSREKCPTLTVASFLVGAFSFKEKSPTITVASFFFFRQTTELIAYVPLFTETDKFTQAKFDQCKLTAKGPPFRFLPFLRNLQNRKTPKGPPFQFFFGTVRIFFSKIFNFSKEFPLRIF